jgi:hypothetical protein
MGCLGHGNAGNTSKCSTTTLQYRLPSCVTITNVYRLVSPLQMSTVLCHHCKCLPSCVTIANVYPLVSPLQMSTLLCHHCKCLPSCVTIANVYRLVSPLQMSTLLCHHEQLFQRALEKLIDMWPNSIDLSTGLLIGRAYIL